METPTQNKGVFLLAVHCVAGNGEPYTQTTSVHSAELDMCGGRGETVKALLTKRLRDMHMDRDWKATLDGVKIPKFHFEPRDHLEVPNGLKVALCWPSKTGPGEFLRPIFEPVEGWSGREMVDHLHAMWNGLIEDLVEAKPLGFDPPFTLEAEIVEA